MLNISELTLYYIQISFQEELKRVIYTSFSILEMFGLKFYEDKYIELIQRDDTIDTDNKRDNFLHLLQQDILKIINEHQVFLDKDMGVTLNECNEIAHFLYIVQKLEDYTDISYRLHAQDRAKNILVDMIESLSLISKSRLMEIIERVDDSLIASLKQFIEDKEKDLSEEDTVDIKRIKYIQNFFNFIGENPCIGKNLYEKGFTSVTLEELTNLLTINLADHIDKEIMNNLAQSALDVLSVLIITKDNYNLPLIKFSKFNYLFTNKLENVTKLHATMLAMLNDFNMHLEVVNQKELVNDQARILKEVYNLREYY